jgi:hypothetical protein
MTDQRVVQSEDKANLHARERPTESAVVDPASSKHDQVVRLHQTLGNATVARMMAQRQAGTEEDVQAQHERVGSEGGPVGPDTASRIQAMRGSGSPLDSATRATMEATFGTSFGDVRVHTGSESNTLNRRLTARAFTTGSDIFLRNDANPSDSRIMAHELSHVVQQRSMTSSGAMRVGPAGDQHEQHADHMATSMASGSPPTALAQRQAAEDELQASHDLAQRQEEEDVQALHDLAQRQSDEEEMAT